MDGWIKISRSITDHWIFSNAVYFKWWIDLLLMANIKDNDVLVGAQVVKLKRGQMIASLNFLATRWSVNKFRVRRFLKLLESERMIETICNKKAQQITICNYASYQDVRNDDATMTQPPCNDDATMTQPNIRKKEGKKERNNNKEKNKKEIDNSTPQVNISKKLSEIILPEFAPAMEEWLQYKRQRKESYKSDKSIEQCYKNLVKLSGDNPDIAMEIVHQSMANNWQGLFELKQKKPSKYGYTDDNATAERNKRTEAVKQHIAYLLATNEEPKQG